MKGMLSFALYVSSHGFGHATRMAALAREFNRFGILTHIRSTRPEHLWRALDPDLSSLEAVSIDVGVKHKADLEPDLEATREALLGLMKQRLDIIDREVDFLRREQIDLIIADIPWLVVEAGSYAQVPVFAVSNFDWVFIYSQLFADLPELRPLINTIYALYHRTDHAFRLPFSSARSMAAFRSIEKVGLLAAVSEDVKDIRGLQGLTWETPILTCAFGGEGDLDLDLDKLCPAWPGLVLSRHESRAGNHIQVPAAADFSDLIHNSNALLTKPGYSSFAEAVQYGTKILYRARPHYPEEEILISGLKKYRGSWELQRLDLSTSAWKRLFHSVLDSPTPNYVSNANASVAGTIIKRYLELRKTTATLESVFDIGSNNLNYALFETGAGQPVHTAQLATGLGRNYKLLSSGEVRIPTQNITRFKSKVSRFLALEHHVPSQKQALATGIQRRTAISGQLADWFQRRWQIDYRVLSEQEEAEWGWLAARDLVPEFGLALVVDVGGFSTELSLGDKRALQQSVSLPLGLLTLQRGNLEGHDTWQQVRNFLASVSLPRPESVICIGLAATTLARQIRTIRFPSPAKLHGIRISRVELDLPSSNDTGQELLDLSARFYALILDHFYATSFTVCHYGLSFGYSFRLRRRKRRSIIQS